MSFSPDSKLTIKALEMAWEARGDVPWVATIQAGSSGSYCGVAGSGRV